MSALSFSLFLLWGSTGTQFQQRHTRDNVPISIQDNRRVTQHPDTLTDIRMCDHTSMPTSMPTHARTHIRTYAQTHTHTPTGTHAHTYAGTHTLIRAGKGLHNVPIISIFIVPAVRALTSRVPPGRCQLGSAERRAGDRVRPPRRRTQPAASQQPRLPRA